MLTGLFSDRVQAHEMEMMKAMRNRVLILGTLAALSGAVVMATPTDAQAQAKPAFGKSKLKQAVAAFKAAKKLFDAKDYAGALESYRKAEGLLPGAKPKFMIGQSLDLANKPAEAIAAYQVFLDSKPSAKKHQTRIDAATKRIGELKATLPGVVNVTVTPGEAKATITVDGKAEKNNACPNSCTLELAPGAHKVVVSADGYASSSHEVEVTAGGTHPVAATLKPTAPAAPPATAPVAPVPEPLSDEAIVDEADGRSKVPAYVTLGVAGAGAVLGSVFGVQALGAKSDFDADPTVDNADKAERSALIADMSFGVALTFGITGTVLLFSDDGAEEDSAAVPTLTPFAGTKGGGMAATWIF